MIYKFLIGILIGLGIALLIIYLRNRAINRAINKMESSEDPYPVRYLGQNLFNFITNLIHRLKL